MAHKPLPKNYMLKKKVNVFRCDSSLFLVIFEVFDPKLPSLSASLPSFTPAPRMLFASSLKSQISVKSL